MEKTIECLFCHKSIEKPRIEKERIVQKFCNVKCHDAYHNLSKKNIHEIRYHIREILRLVGGFND